MSNTILVEQNPFFMNDMDKICIVCNHQLIKQPTHSIFDEVAKIEPQTKVFNALVLISNFKQINIENGPDKICDICYNNTSAALKFRNMCDKAVSFLETYLKHQEEMEGKVETYNENETSMNVLVSPEAVLITPERKTPKTELIDSDNDENEKQEINEDHKKNEKQVTSIDTLNVQCKVCHKFYRSYYIKMHMRVHTGERPHSCQHCDKKFMSSTDLKKHIAGVHSDTRAFLCNTCGKSFKIQSIFHHHLKLHNDDRPYECKTCGKSFKTAAILKNHKVVHSDNKPFTCEVCGKCFSLKKHLRQHMISHAEVKKHECHLCGNRFTQAHTLRTHLSNHCRGSK